MTPKSVDDLIHLLVERQLISYDDARSVQQQLPAQASPADTLQQFERRQLLTAFQVQRIQKGETDGLVLGGCRLLYRNASGSFARLYRGARIATGEMVGIKVLRERWSNDPDTVQLFHREGDIGKRLKHPNIVPIYEVGAQGKFHYILMDFVEGGNLRDFIKVRQKLEPVEACRYTLDMARALQYAVDQGVTHRDLKMTNVLMSSQGVARLIDFGLAADDKFLNRAGSPDLAQALEYSTLEKNTNAPRNDPRSDLFFLGTILYELLTGSAPYERTRDREERKQFSRYRDIRPVTSRAPGLPPVVAQIVDQLLQVNPALRFQKAGDVATAIEMALKNLGHAATPAIGVPIVPDSRTKTLLCVEHRTNRQDILREYFSKHGYRVLLLGDADRALSRLKSMPTQGVILFGDSMGDRIADDFRQAIEATSGTPVVVAAVLSDSQQAFGAQLSDLDRRGVVLHQPVRLRDLRERLEAGMS